MAEEVHPGTSPRRDRATIQPEVAGDSIHRQDVARIRQKSPHKDRVRRTIQARAQTSPRLREGEHSRQGPLVPKGEHPREPLKSGEHQEEAEPWAHPDIYQDRGAERMAAIRALAMGAASRSDPGGLLYSSKRRRPREPGYRESADDSNRGHGNTSKTRGPKGRGKRRHSIPGRAQGNNK